MKRTLAFTIAVVFGLNALPASAQIFTQLHSFTGVDGSQPRAGLSALGNTLYGTTRSGGTAGAGVVFTVNTDGSGFNVLHNFSGGDGAGATADLLLSGNILYGATFQGGDANSQGTLFSLGTDGSAFTNIHLFNGGVGGVSPAAGMLQFGNILYGTTSAGAVDGIYGAVFSIEPNGANFKVLHTFTGADGEDPRGDLLLYGSALFGTTYSGGESNLGEIFSVLTDGENFRVVHSFSNLDGTQPIGGLVLASGKFYGTTTSGGEYGAGTIFSLKPDGTEFSVLHSFFRTPVELSTDGMLPTGTLCLLSNILYGTTFSGGSNGAGTVFGIDVGGKGYTQLFSFGGTNADGNNPECTLVAVGNSLYGTTVSGGAGKVGTAFALQVRGVGFVYPPIGETNVAVGSTVTFSAGALSLNDGGAPLEYQWRLNGVNIPGATNPTLTFGKVQPTNGGSLTVTISDGVDASTSLPVEFSVTIPAVAINNNMFASRYQLGKGASGVVSSSNVGATREKGEPKILGSNPGGKSIWFQWQPGVTGTAIFSTQGSDFDTIMGVYTGTIVSGLARVPSAIGDDDYGGYLTSIVSFNCTAGTAYQIAVDGYWGASGNVVLSWQTEQLGEAIPSVLQAPPVQTVVSNGTAVTFVCDVSAGNASWFFNGQATGVTGNDYIIKAVTAKTVGEYFAQVSEGGGVVATEPAHLQINLIENGTSDRNSAAWIKFLDSAHAAYDDPGLTSLHKLGGGGDTRGYSVSQLFSTVGATGEPGEPNIAGQIGGAPVWYSYVAPTNGAMIVNTAGSSFNTMLGVFVGSGDSFATLSNVGAAYTTNRILNGQPQIYAANVPKGRTNFIVVDGYHGASGLAHLNIDLGAPVVIDSPPQDQYVLHNGVATFSVGVSGSTPFFYSWQFDGTNIEGATDASLIISNAQGSDLGSYTVVVSNLVSVASNSAMLLPGETPTITTQPQSGTVTPGGTAILTVVADGTPAPSSYEWMFNGAEIGTNGSSLVISNFDASNQGAYSVVVSNSVGSVTSDNATLLLNTLDLNSPLVGDAGFQAELIGAAGGSYIIQASTDLLTWIPFLTNNTTNGFLFLADTNFMQFNYRFFRGVTN